MIEGLKERKGRQGKKKNRCAGTTGWECEEKDGVREEVVSGIVGIEKRRNW